MKRSIVLRLSGAIAAAAFVAGCSGGASPFTAVNSGSNSASLKQNRVVLSVVDRRIPPRYHGLQGIAAPASARVGIYTNEFALTSGNVLGYPKYNTSNNGPTCTESTGTNVNGIGVDHQSRLIVPNAFNGILVYSGPNMCGSQLADIPDSLGQAVDAAANNAATGNIVVGHANGFVAACTMASNSCTQLSANNLFTFSFVAMDRGGNCYADSIDANTGAPALWYWTKCAGTATEITSSQGFVESSYGGIDVDNDGDLVVLTLGSPSTLTVYSGCGTGTCTLVTGPTPLAGAGSNECVYGHVGRLNGFYACGDYTAGQVDIYSYGPSKVPVYKYSFNNGLSQSNVVEAASYAPESKL